MQINIVAPLRPRDLGFIMKPRDLDEGDFAEME